MKNWRTVVGGLLAVALASTLAFLYMKTEAIDFKKQSLILSYLRNTYPEANIALSKQASLTLPAYQAGAEVRWAEVVR